MGAKNRTVNTTGMEPSVSELKLAIADESNRAG